MTGKSTIFRYEGARFCSVYKSWLAVGGVKSASDTQSERARIPSTGFGKGPLSASHNRSLETLRGTKAIQLTAERRHLTCGKEIETLLDLLGLSKAFEEALDRRFRSKVSQLTKESSYTAPTLARHAL